MAQRDYVARGRTSARRKKSSPKKKKTQGLPKTTLAVAIAIVLVFIGGLYFISQNKKISPQGIESLKPVKPANTLPPKPEERWRYIKELENRGVDMPTYSQGNSGTSNITRAAELTPEQRQLLEQIDADRQQPVTTLTEVPYNAQPVPRSQVIITEPTAPVTPVKRPEIKPEIRNETAPARQAEVKPVAPPVEKKPVVSVQKMLVQCGSFRLMEQAESVRATLAFSGIESRVSSGGGWYRIVLGPYSKETAEKMQTRASDVGVSGCILRASGG